MTPQAYKNHLIELADEGANIEIIYNALKPPDMPEHLKDSHPVGLQLHEGELSPEWNQLIKRI